MNYSPITNQNKGYESDGQEKSNLMNDNPIASRASGGTFMSQHTQSGMGGSPLMLDPTKKDVIEPKLTEELTLEEKIKENEAKYQEKINFSGNTRSDEYYNKNIKPLDKERDILYAQKNNKKP